MRPERESNPVKHRQRSINWRHIAAGGCLGIGLLAFPYVVSFLAMIIWAFRQENESPTTRRDVKPRTFVVRTPLPRPVECYEVRPQVVAAIEARLTVHGGTLRGTRAVSPGANSRQRIVGAEVDGGWRSESGDNIGVWLVSWEGATPVSTPSSITAVNDVAAQTGAFTRAVSEKRLVTAVHGCVERAVGR